MRRANSAHQEDAYTLTASHATPIGQGVAEAVSAGPLVSAGRVRTGAKPAGKHAKGYLALRGPERKSTGVCALRIAGRWALRSVAPT